MRQYFKGNMGNRGILRQSIAFLLACLLFVSVLPATYRVQAADPITTTNHYEWKQIKTQADIPAKGTYPMLLCYTDLNGNDWFLTGNSLKQDKEIFRDGVSQKRNDWPIIVKNRYNAWLAENGLSDNSINKSSYMQQFPTELKLLTQYQDQPLGSGDETNYMIASDAADYPEIALYSETFFTKTAPSSWKMIVTGEKINGLKTIQIQSGGKYLYDDWEYRFPVSTLAMISWNNEKGTNYSVYTTEVTTEISKENGGRKGWTLDGYVQLFYYEYPGSDTGLCWDYEKFGGIEDDDDHYSSFKLYYGVYKEFSVIDRDYVITNGSILYANNNLELMPNVNLIIEPGGILSVDGVFFHNGVIHNCGTMILNPGAFVTTLEAKNSTCGQINCYGADHMDISVALEGNTSLYSEWYGKPLTELSEKLKSLDAQIAKNEAVIMEQVRIVGGGFDERLMEETAELEELRKKLEEIFLERRDHPEKALEIMRQSVSSASYSFSGCQGDLIILDDAVLLFANQPESSLKLNEGSTCSNLGVIVAPAGLRVDGGEFINESRAHLFIGYCFEQDMGNDERPVITGAGTEKACIAGLKASAASSALFDLSGKYHVKNDGTLLLNGTLSRTATGLEPGSRFYDKRANSNQKYYSW